MKKKTLRKFIPFMLFFALLLAGSNAGGATQSSDQSMKAAPAVKAEENVYKGMVVGKSNKAKTISISVGKGKDAKTMMVKFDDQTQGLEHVEKGHAAIIKYRIEGQDRIATVIKPKLAKLPEGVAETQPDYVAELIAKGGNYFLVDSRPCGRFDEGSIVTAVSIPVPELNKNAAALLPKNKSMELIFFCGGPT